MLETHEIERIDPAVLTPNDVRKRVSMLRQLNNSAPAFVDCARAFLSFGMFREAVEAYTSAIEVEHDSGVGYLGRAEAGYSILLLSADEQEQARVGAEVVGDFRRVIELTNGERHEGVVGLGAALLALNRFAECSDLVQQELSHCTDRSHEGDLWYLFGLCRLFSGDLDQAIEYADKMERVAGFDTERFFIRALVALLRGDREELIENRAALQRRDVKFVHALVAIESGAACETFLDLARLLA